MLVLTVSRGSSMAQESGGIREKIMAELQKVVDPEIGVSIVELRLVEEVKVEDGNVHVTFHLTAPYCPPVFALMMCRDIRQRVNAIEGVKGTTVKVLGHALSDLINQEANKDTAVPTV